MIEEEAPTFTFDSQTAKVVEAADRENRSEQEKGPHTFDSFVSANATTRNKTDAHIHYDDKQNTKNSGSDFAQTQPQLLAPNTVSILKTKTRDFYMENLNLEEV